MTVTNGRDDATIRSAMVHDTSVDVRWINSDGLWALLSEAVDWSGGGNAATIVRELRSRMAVEFSEVDEVSGPGTFEWRGTTSEYGGGRFTVLVDVDTERYPDNGTRVVVRRA